MNRRNFLKILTASSAAVPIVSSLGLGLSTLIPSKVQAFEGSLKRVVFVYVPGGCPSSASQYFTPSSDFSLKECSRPLESVKDQCVFFKNMNIVGGGAHGLTQRVLGAFATNAHATLDLTLADTVGLFDPISALRLGVQSRQKEAISARRWSVVTDYIDNPAAAYNRLFSSPSFQGTNDSISQYRFEVHAEAIKALQSTLGNAEQNRLLEHQSAIENLQNKERLVNVDSGLCGQSIFNADNLNTDVLDNNFSHLMALQTQNIVMALQCQLTRVVTLQLGTHQSDFSVTGFESDYHSAIHSGSLERYAQYRTYFSEQVAYLIQSLKTAIDPATGDSLLNSTLVVQVTDMGDGNSHTGTDAPFMLAGGGASINRGSIVQLENHHQLLDIVSAYMGVHGTIPYFHSTQLAKGVLA